MKQNAAYRTQLNPKFQERLLFFYAVNLFIFNHLS